MSDVPSLLPPNASTLERNLEQATGRMSGLPVDVAALWDPMTCPAVLLPWLAWALEVDPWNSAWSERLKRQAIAASPAVHRKRGTPWAVSAALEAVDYPVSLVEWWQETPAADPFTFKATVLVDDRGITEDTEAEITALIDGAKNLRSHLTNLTLIGRLAGSAGAAGTPRSRMSVTVMPEAA